MKKPLRNFIPKTGNYKVGWYPPHPTLYLKKDIYKRYGLYDLKYKIAADYDFMLRIMKNNVKLSYINDYLICMRGGGVSTNGFKGYFKSFNESLKVLRHNNIKCPLFVNILRTFNILKQKLQK